MMRSFHATGRIYPSQRPLTTFAQTLPSQALPKLSGSLCRIVRTFYMLSAVDRYAITGTMPVKYNEDGSLGVYMQAQSPGHSYA